MGWNGSGGFSRLFSWVADKAAGLDISSSRMDTDTDDITANGFGNCLTRDGQGVATANLPMNGFRHTGVANAQARSDYAAAGQVQDGLLNWTIAGGTADAITATYTPVITVLADGQLCVFRASAANATTTPTFAPNGLTARTITKIGGIALMPGDIPGSRSEVILRYDLANTRWELLNPAGQSFFAGTAGGTANALTVTDAQFQSGNGQIIQFYAANTNSGAATLAVSGGGAISIVKDAVGGPAALTGNEISAGNFCTVVYDSANTRFHLLAAAPQVGAAQLLTSAGGFDAPINLQLNASVGSNLLTVAVKGINGSDPSLANPALVPFRDSTLTNGGPVWLSITSALSINTNATGATLGSSNGTPFRFWIVVFNNAGTAVLGLINCSVGSQTFPCDEASLQSTTAMSAGATSGGIFYTPNGTTLTSKAFRIIGMLEYSSGLTTAGTYNNPPTKVQLFGPGVTKPGGTVQEIYGVASSATITPTSKINLVRVIASATITTGNGGATAAANLARGVTNIGASQNVSCTAGTVFVNNAFFVTLDTPAATAATTYGITGSNGSFSNQQFDLAEVMG